MVRRLCTLLLLSLLGIAFAQCSVAAGSELDNLTLEGFGTAYFGNLRFDQTEDLVEFYGGVCIAGIGWALLTEQVLISGLSGDLQLSATIPELRIPGFVITGDALTATEEILTMTGIRLQGPDLSGTAATLQLDLKSNELTLISPKLIGSTLLVIGDRAVLSGSRLAIDGAIVTTCLCSDRPLYTVRGNRVDIDLASEHITLTGGSVHLGPLALGLPSEVELDPSDLEQLEFPFRITFEPDLPGTEGEGLGFEVPRAELAPGISARLDLIGLDPGHPVGGRALLRGRARGIRFDFGMIDGGISSEIIATTELLPWLEADFALRNFDRASADRLHEGVLSVTASTLLGLPDSLGRLGVDLGAFAAASAQALPANRVSGARLGTRLGALYLTPATRVGRGEIDTELEAILYPDTPAHQLAARIAPSWTVEAGPLALELGYERQWTDAGSPFSVRLDRRQPTSAITAELALAVDSTDIEAELHLDLDYDLLKSSWSRLRGGGVLAIAPSAVDRVTLSVDSELLGILSAGEDAWIETRVGWSRELAGGTAELRLDVRNDLAPTADLAWLDVSASYPFTGRDARVTPYLAFDLAPLLWGSAPSLSGHGLDLVWYSCCGTLLLGYRLDRRGLVTTFGVQLTAAPASGTILPVEQTRP